MDHAPFEQRLQNARLRRQRGRADLNTSHVALQYDMDDFHNSIPPAPHELGGNTEEISESERSSLHFETMQNVHYVPEAGQYSDTYLTKAGTNKTLPPYEDFIAVKSRQSKFQTFIWPAFAICVPMIILSAMLLFIIFRYAVRPVQDIFGTENSLKQFKGSRFILVNFSATKLVFLASFLSTLAPLLAGCIMTLTAVIVYQELKKSSNVAYFANLPTPYQMSLLIGVLAASYEQLFNTLGYLISNKRLAKTSRVLLYAMVIFIISIMLGMAVTITDAYLHIATQTVPVTLYSGSTSQASDLGRGLNSYCLAVDRINNNSGYPCSLAASQLLYNNPDYRRGRPEIQQLAHDSSNFSTIHVADNNNTSGGKIAYLMPQTNLMPVGTNFRTTSIGVGTKCQLMPPTMCNLTRWNNGIYTSFNCSENFWGTLGKDPVSQEISFTGRVLTPYLSFLAINRNANLIYNYFTDQELKVVYNTAGLNASALQEKNASVWSDADLRNPIYMGFAWRSATSSFTGTSKNGMVQSNLVQRYDNISSIVDYFVNCEVTTYDVEYTWHNGSLHTLHVNKHVNGTILNLWTGNADYTPRVSGSDYNLLSYNIQSMIAGNSTSSYENRFGELLSRDVIATIGAYTSGRQVLQAQDQTTILVAKVPKSALGSLLACSLLYPVLGMTLLVKAKKAADKTGPMTPLFSYWGLASAAFLAGRPAHNSGVDDLSPAKRNHDHEEAIRCFIQEDEVEGHRFGLWRRSQAGHISEVQHLKTNISTWI